MIALRTSDWLDAIRMSSVAEHNSSVSLGADFVTRVSVDASVCVAYNVISPVLVPNA